MKVSTIKIEGIWRKQVVRAHFQSDDEGGWEVVLHLGSNTQTLNFAKRDRLRPCPATVVYLFERWQNPKAERKPCEPKPTGRTKLKIKGQS